MPVGSRPQLGRVVAAPSNSTTKDTKLEQRASDALLEGLHVEVHQESNAAPRQLEVGQNLSLMEARQRLDRLHFDDDCVVDNKIEPVASNRVPSYTTGSGTWPSKGKRRAPSSYARQCS